MLKRIVTVFLVLALASFAFGQKKSKEPQEKSLRGIVSDASGAAVPGAVVQLKNLKTLQVRSFIARDTGEYVFQGLATDVDYEVKAEANGRASAAKTLSSFDSHPEATLNLQLK